MNEYDNPFRSALSVFRLLADAVFVTGSHTPDTKLLFGFGFLYELLPNGHCKQYLMYPIDEFSLRVFYSTGYPGSG